MRLRPRRGFAAPTLPIFEAAPQQQAPMGTRAERACSVAIRQSAEHFA
jgi:hypothetical protein